ncbi:MAG: homoserine kinase [Liquorilactobacillus satsumensis]
MALKIKVPATSANLGPGFDSLGIAVDRYLTLIVEEKTSKWELVHHMGKIYHDERNLIVQTALKLVPTLHPYRIKVLSDIPLARGLGSSSSAIVAGIELADQLAGLQLTTAEKVQFAAQIEGHPDNVAPAVMGGLVISTYIAEQALSIKADFPDVSLVAYVPADPLLTVESRKVLPRRLPFKKAVAASSVANALTAALLAKQLDKVKVLLESDQFHETYRRKLVPQLAQVRALAHEYQTYGTYLSGAGPTVMTLVAHPAAAEFAQALKAHFETGEVLALKCISQGPQVTMLRTQSKGL